jgi:hypothetical protein
MTDHALRTALRHAYGDDAEDDRGEHASALAYLQEYEHGHMDDFATWSDLGAASAFRAGPLSLST